MTEQSWHTKALAFKSDTSATDVADDEPVLMLIEGINPFRDKIYCYIKLPYANYRKMREKMMQKEKFNPRDYGEVVAAGLGQPTDEVKKEIKDEYGFVPVSVNDTPTSFDFEEVDDYPF
jgi:hypothetical protein